jgi:hypothetical protein
MLHEWLRSLAPLSQAASTFFEATSPLLLTCLLHRNDLVLLLLLPCHLAGGC